MQILKQLQNSIDKTLNTVYKGRSLGGMMGWALHHKLSTQCTQRTRRLSAKCVSGIAQNYPQRYRQKLPTSLIFKTPVYSNPSVPTVASLYRHWFCVQKIINALTVVYDSILLIFIPIYRAWLVKWRWMECELSYAGFSFKIAGVRFHGYFLSMLSIRM